MKILIIIFSLLGVGLHIRTLGFLIDSHYSGDFAVLWAAASLPNRVLTIGAMLIPFAFYALCGLSCLVKARSWRVTLCGAVVVLCAVPYFIKLDAMLPTVARSALLTAMFSIPYYLAKPKTRTEPDDVAISE